MKYGSLLFLWRQYAFLCLLLVCVGCGSSDEEAEAEAKKPVIPAEEMYQTARDMLLENRYQDAAAAFDDVEREHPYSEWAARSQILSAFANYRAMHYDEAVIALERFLELYPSHESVDYAYYLIALCYYEQISDVGRDQGMTRNARKALTDVVRRFPDTDYARDAKIKLDLTNDHLAGKEMMIGRYYANRKEYLAATNRFRAVIEQYDTTSHTPEALHRLVELYLLLGVTEQAEQYAAVLGHNYPTSDWYRKSYTLLREKSPASLTKGEWWNPF
jgi:outer membrane protein assembly factor BamD